MSKTLLLAALCLLLLAIAIVALLALQRPDTFRVERSTRIQAPPAPVFALINNMRQFNTWNPYSLKDPEMKGSYRGPEAGPGAAYDFAGKKSGSGSVEILQATAPSEVKMRLDMSAPFKAQNIITFSLRAQDDATLATWAMEGPSPFLGKFMGVLFSMDKMIGKDFEDGLAGLKASAEKPS